MAAVSERNQESVPQRPGGLGATTEGSRIVYALALAQRLLNDPTLPDILTRMGQSPDQARAVKQRMKIMEAEGDPVNTYKSTAFYSSDDRVEIGKPLQKPAIKIPASTVLGPALRIDSPFIGAAVITVCSPANSNLLQNSFVKYEVLTPAEGIGAKMLFDQTGYLARWVILDTDFPRGDSQGNGYLDVFVKSAYFDQKPPIKFNRGWAGFLSGRGVGAVIDASRRGDQIHVDEFIKGKESKTHTWVISSIPGLTHPVVGRKVNTQV